MQLLRVILFCTTTILEPIVKIYEECFWVHSHLVELHRSSHWRCSEKKGVPKSFSKFTGKDVVFSRSATLFKNHLSFVSIYYFKLMKVEISGKTSSKCGRKTRGIYQKIPDTSLSFILKTLCCVTLLSSFWI